MYSNPLHVAILLTFLVIGAGVVATIRGIKGVMVTLIIGWLFLSHHIGFNPPGLPAFNKDAAVAYAILIGVLMVESKALMAIRFKLLDIPIAVWLVVPFFSSLTNGLGFSDGISEVYLAVIRWGIPYFIGRALIRTPRDVRTMALALVCAGLAAAPFALWESRMSPQLHKTVYGFHVAKFHMAVRLGGYRPMLFMRHGLEVGLWMATASAAGLWLVFAGRQIKLAGHQITGYTVFLVITTILCRSLGSLILLVGTTVAALLVRSSGIRFVFIALILTPSIYLSLRLTDTLPAEQLASLVEVYDDQRAESFESRLNQEQVITKHALKRPVFGWGGYNRYRPTDEYDATSAVDGLTMLTLGKNGIVGLVALLSMFVFAPMLIILRLHGRELARPFWAPTIAILLGVMIASLDSLFNAFITPVHIVGLGALTTVSTLIGPWKNELRRQQSMARAAAQQPNPPADSSVEESTPPEEPSP